MRSGSLPVSTTQMKGLELQTATASATFQLKSGVKIYGGFVGSESELGQRDILNNRSILSGDIDADDENSDGNHVVESVDQIVGANSFNVVVGSLVDEGARLDGFTITAGQADGDGDQRYGAGIFIEEGHPTISQCRFVGNQGGQGGGIRAHKSDGRIVDCSFTGNDAISGGAIEIGFGAPSITRCDFDNNSASQRGGAIAFSGGSYADADPRVEECKFIGNHSARDGGAISSYLTGHPEIIRSIFRANTAEGDGGAIWANDASASIEGCLIVGNFAGDDGGACYHRARTGDVEGELEYEGINIRMVNCTISGNACGDAGGGLYNSSVAPPLEIVNSIIWNNRGSVSHPDSSQSVHNSGTNFSPLFVHSLVEHIDLVESGSRNLDGTYPGNAPLFEVAADPDTAPNSVGEFRLRDLSPASDAGKNDVVTTTLDLAGRPRIDSLFVDMGAYESTHAGPSVAAPLAAPISFPATQTSQDNVLDLTQIFDNSAVVFGMIPTNAEAPFETTFDGAVIHLSAIGLASIGQNTVRVWASDGVSSSVYDVIILITSPRVYVDSQAPPGGDGKAWSTAFQTIPEAIAAVRDPAIGKEVWVAEGVYFPDEGPGRTEDDRSMTFSLDAAIRLFGGFDRTELSPNDRGIQSRSILSGDLQQDDLDADGDAIANVPGDVEGLTARHVVTYSTPGEPALLDGFVITGGDASSSVEEDQFGGGVSCLQGELHLHNCVLSGNTAEVSGGAVYAIASIRLTNCTLHGNTAGQSGAALRTQGSSSHATLLNCLVSGNSCNSGTLFFNGGAAELIHCTISGNHGSSPYFSQAGGVYALSGAVSMENTVIWNNSVGPAQKRGLPLSSFRQGSNATFSFSHSLVQNHDLSLSDPSNLNGLDPANAPMFFAPNEPIAAPSPAGDYRIPMNSPLTDAGTPVENTPELDLLGSSRQAGAGVDIGSIESPMSPVLASSPQSFEFTLDSELQNDFVDLAEIFGSSANSYLIAAVSPPERFTLGLSGSTLSLHGIGDHSLGLTTVFVTAQSASGQESLAAIPIRVVGERLYVSEFAAPGGTGASWASPLGSLQDGLALSRFLGIDEIWVAEGVYYPDDGLELDDGDDDLAFNISSGQRLIGGFGGTETSVNQSDPSRYRTILSGDIGQDDSDENGDHIIDDPDDIDEFNACPIILIEGAGSSTLVDGFTFTAAGAFGENAALTILGGDPLVRNCDFIGNGGSVSSLALRYSGIKSVDATPLIESCFFARNLDSAAGVEGGAPKFRFCIFEDGTASGGSAVSIIRDASPKFYSCQFKSNVATSQGGAILNWDSSSLFEDCLFSDNSTTWNGSAIQSEGDSKLTILHSEFADNYSKVGDSGAISSDQGTSMVIIGCRFERNISDGGAGAIYAEGPSLKIFDSEFYENSGGPGAIEALGSTFTMQDCIVAGNTSRSTGGISSSADTLLDNVLLSGNSSSGRVGAIAAAALELRNCTITGNSAEDFGGATCSVGGEFVITNSIIWNNRSAGSTTSPSASIKSAGTPTFSNSFVANFDLSEISDGGFDGTDPLLAPQFVTSIDPNSAPTTAGNFRLASSSPLIDGGSNATVSGLHDLAGQPRIREGSLGGEALIDLGVYEYQPTPPASFTSLFPGLSPSGDANSNGRSNFLDYATGFDPNSPSSIATGTALNHHGEKTRYTFYRRRDASDVVHSLEQSSSLLQGTWIPLVENLDYETIENLPVSADRQKVTIKLLHPLEESDRHFFRQRITSQ